MWAIYKKELKIYFLSLRTYILISAFLVLSGFFFYTSVKFFGVLLDADVVKGLWENYFDLLRLVLILMLPLLTMGVFAEEKKMGTLELLWSYPLKDWEILIGKFLSCLTVFFLLLILNFCYPAVLNLYYSFSWGPLFACYLGCFLLGAFFISSGILISFTTENEIVAAAVSFSLFLLFWFLTWNEAAYTPEVLNVLLRISVFDRFREFTRGIVVVKDVIFFVSATVLFITITYRAMRMRDWG
ncbi:MAG: ABC transporter permease subunit [Deltaproteobacteria bacterium]|nr:ABC transporter permease subunit [Deltaproteobacteria bacterium]